MAPYTAALMAENNPIEGDLMYCDPRTHNCRQCAMYEDCPEVA